jgi:pimeloyl-ACP methyl ester carboxylesterase
MAGPGSAARSVTSAVAGSAARDRDTPGETADAVPAAELVRIPGAGHLSPLEAPAALSSAILSWWSRVW